MLGSRLVTEVMNVEKAAAVDVKHGCTDKRSSRAGYVPIGGKNTVFKRFDNVHFDVSNFETDDIAINEQSRQCPNRKCS